MSGTVFTLLAYLAELNYSSFEVYYLARVCCYVNSQQLSDNLVCTPTPLQGLDYSGKNIMM